MANLNAAARKALPKQDFAVPQKAGTPQGKAKGGSYPIPDKSHARNALARSSGKTVAGQVRAAVNRKFPGLAKAKGNTANVKSASANIKSRLSRKSRNKTSIGF